MFIELEEKLFQKWNFEKDGDMTLRDKSSSRF